MTTTVKISRIIEVSGNAADGWVTIKAKLEDGSEGNVIIHAPVADGLLAPLHQTLRKMADLVQRGPIAPRPGQVPVQALGIQTLHVGYDSQSRAAIILFDQGLPSQVGYRLDDHNIAALEQGLAQVTKDRSGKHREQHH